MREPLPLATLHDAVIDFLRNRDDAVLFAAQAVNAYVDEPRMTQDVDILSTRASDLTEEIRSYLATKFTIAARVREVAAGRGFRIFQLRQPKDRDLVFIRQVKAFPCMHVIAEVRVPVPEQLIAAKVISLTLRLAQPNAGLDRRDVKMLLIAYPQLKAMNGPVMECLTAAHATSQAVAEWKTLVASDISAAYNSDEF